MKISRIDDLWYFWCPACETHHCVSDRWIYNGHPDAPTFTPSVLVNVGRACPDLPLCHMYVTDGKIQYLDDCTHKLAGQTVEMEDID